MFVLNPPAVHARLFHALLELTGKAEVASVVVSTAFFLFHSLWTVILRSVPKTQIPIINFSNELTLSPK